MGQKMSDDGMSSNTLYSRDFRMSVLKLLMRERKFFDSYSSFVKSEYLPEQDLKVILAAIQKVGGNSDSGIDKFSIEAEIMDMASLRHFDSEHIIGILSEMWDMRIKNEVLIENSLSTWIKRERIKRAFYESIDDIKSGQNLEKVLHRIDEAISVGIGLDSGMTYSDLKKLHEMYSKFYDPKLLSHTGFESYDIAVGNGMAKGEVHTIMGAPKVGKSTFAVNIGANVAVMNKSVIHFTMELSEMDILAKYACRFSGLSYSDLLLMSNDEYQEKISKFDKYKPDIHIKHYVNGTVDAMTFRSFIASKRSKGEIGDIGLIIVDYDDLILPVVGSTDSMYDNSGNVYGDLIRLADYFSCPLLTLAQPKRDAWDKMGRDGEPLYAQDLAHSAKKAHLAWSISSLNKISSSEYMLYVDMSRRGVSNNRIMLHGDLNRSLFTES